MKDQKIRITPASIQALAKGDMLNFVAASVPGGIEAQEAAGQQNIINHVQLPIAVGKMKFNLDNLDIEKSKAIWNKLGIKIIDEQDDLFFNVELPAGWKMQSCGGSYWTNLIDAKNRERVSIFYKAAFYDRSAHADIAPRFRVSIKKEFEIDWKKARNMSQEELDELCKKAKESLIFGVVLDCNKIIFEMDHEEEKEAGAYFDQTNKFNKICKEYLIKNYPDWENPFAYWDLV